MTPAAVDFLADLRLRPAFDRGLPLPLSDGLQGGLRGDRLPRTEDGAVHATALLAPA